MSSEKGLPKELALGSNKPMAHQGKPSINRYRSDNSTYGAGDVIRIEIPCGREGQYLFPKDSFIEAKVRVNYTSVSTTVGSIAIDQSCYALFNRMRIYHGSNMVEDTLYTNRLWTSIYDLQVNENKRRNDCINKMVYDNSTVFSGGVGAGAGSNTGLLGYNLVYIPTATTASTAVDSTAVDFCFQLPSALLGTLAQKALPIGLMSASSLYLELELASIATAFINSLSAGTFVINSFTVSDIYYNAKISTLPSDVHSLILQSTGGTINLPSVSYKTEMKTIATGSSAFNDKFSFQFSSLKNFLFWFQNSTSATDITKRSISSRPRANLNDYYLSINGEVFPSQAIANPSRMFSELLRAYDALSDNSMGGILTYQNYINSNTHTTADDTLVDATNQFSASAKTQKRFLAGINLDRFGSGTNDTLLHGTSSIGQMINVQLNFSSATSEVLNLYASVMFDVVYRIDGGLLLAQY